MAIDDLTWSDLDMDDVFKQMDTCLTSVGDEVLYATLHEPRWDKEPLQKLDQLIAFFADNPKERLKIQLLLSKLGKAIYGDVSSLIFESQIKALKHPMIYTILAIIPLLCLGICFINPTIGVMSLIFSVIVNVVTYYYFKKEIAKTLLTVQYLAAMLCCCHRLSGYETTGSLKELADQIGQDYVPFKAIAGKLSGIMTSGGSDHDLILDYLKIITLYDFRTYNRTIALVSKNKAVIHSLIRAILKEIVLFSSSS